MHNDGFRIGGADCCDAAWIAGYSRRVRTMMREFRRGGAGRVYRLTIPTPGDRLRKPSYAAVNRAVKRAAAGFPRDEVPVNDLVGVFTPRGVYRSTIHGRFVRRPDANQLGRAPAVRIARPDGTAPLGTIPAASHATIRALMARPADGIHLDDAAHPASR